MNAVNVGLVTFIIQHNRIQGVFLLCKITNLFIYSIKIKCVVRIQIKTINEQIQNIAQKKDTLCRRMYN